MADVIREGHVYKAKLAEQAERYDGKCDMSWLSLVHFLLLPQRWSAQ